MTMIQEETPEIKRLKRIPAAYWILHANEVERAISLNQNSKIVNASTYKKQIES